MTSVELWNKYNINNLTEGEINLRQYNIKTADGKLITKVVKSNEKVKAYAETKKCTGDGVNYSIYGTPEEALTKKWAQSLSRYGELEHINDKGYVVNSYHVDPREKIDAFKKLRIESQYLNLCKGGAISYVEIAPMFKNKQALLDLINFIWETIMYGEINTKIDICFSCGHEGEIPLVKTGPAKFLWRCPRCGNTDESKMSCTRRTCGYCGEAQGGNMNDGRLDEIVNRYVHVS